MISRVSEEKLYYLIQLLENVEGLSENMENEQDTSTKGTGRSAKSP